MAVIDFFDRGWRINGSGVAFRSNEEEWTYREAGRMSCRIANRLLAACTAQGTKVAVLSPNAPLPWICVLGTWRAGHVWVPLNPNNPAADNVDLVERFDVEVLFYDIAVQEQAAECLARTDGRLTLIALNGGTLGEAFDTWVADSPETAPLVSSQMDDVVAVSATGGTTGAPKGVMNTHRSFATMVAHQLLALHYPADTNPVNLAAAPLTHTAGILSLQTVVRGGTVVIVERASPENVIDAVERFGVTEVFLPPTVIYRMLSKIDEHTTDMSSLRYILYGAAPMSVARLQEGIDKLGPVFIGGYGQTEAPAAITFLHPEEHLDDGATASDERLSSCGRPSPFISIDIKDIESGETMATGEPGEVCVRGDLLMKGYYKDPAKTADTIRNGWLHTGDIGYLDADGYLHLTDRLKDLIITGGFNVYPNEVEQVIWGHPAVQDCAVVGAPDNEWGERVTAVVELKPSQHTSAAELTGLCHDALGGVRTPKEFLFVDELPRSANGKVLKKDLREQFWLNSPTSI